MAKFKTKDKEDHKRDIESAGEKCAKGDLQGSAKDAQKALDRALSQGFKENRLEASQAYRQILHAADSLWRPGSK